MTPRRVDRGPDAGPAGAPVGAPSGPRRPAAPHAAKAVPGADNSRPSSLVSNTNESTQQGPDLKLRVDDVGRGFLYAPPVRQDDAPPPPVNDGPRCTKYLSPRAVRQLKGSAIKAEKLGLGFRTFMTLTVRAEEREAIEQGGLILGREMKRFINALNQWFRRRGKPLLVYSWVAENPHDSNPHVHLLTNHTVPRAEFDAFAAHLESLWGHGFVHIERIRNGSQAVKYLNKAMGYMLKGRGKQQGFWSEIEESSQGRIWGNRYGIARLILPKYEQIELYDCPEAAYNLRDMQKLLSDDQIEELAPGIWLTKYGLSFEKGTDLDKMRDTIQWLEQVLADEELEGRPHEP